MVYHDILFANPDHFSADRSLRLNCIRQQANRKEDAYGFSVLPVGCDYQLNKPSDTLTDIITHFRQ